MDIIIISNILKAIIMLANFYMFFMFIMAVMSLMAVFGVIDLFSGGLASRIYFTLRRIIDPVLALIGKVVPRVNGFDLPFLVLLVLLWILVDLAKYALASLNYAANFSF